MKREVEILGNKAKISTIKPNLRYPPYRERDELMVVLEFEESVDAILGFAVFLPPKDYLAQEFLDLVRQEGEQALKKMLQQNAESRVKEELRGARQAELETMVGGIESALEH